MATWSQKDDKLVWEDGCRLGTFAGVQHCAAQGNAEEHA